LLLLPSLLQTLLLLQILFLLLLLPVALLLLLSYIAAAAAAAAAFVTADVIVLLLSWCWCWRMVMCGWLFPFTPVRAAVAVARSVANTSDCLFDCRSSPKLPSAPTSNTFPDV